jgi:hypothetical protein
MGFDSKKFLKTKFRHREEEIRVPGLSEFFPDGDPVWKVRGLTGQELGRANEAADRSKIAVALVEALVKGGDDEKKKAAKDLLGVGTGAPEDVAKRMQYLMAGSVDPPCDHELAVRLCEAFPIEFLELTTAILRLTGQGQDFEKKSTPSGEIPTSETVSPSVIASEGDSSMKPDQT